MERAEAIRVLMGCVDMVRVHTITTPEDDLFFALEIADAFRAIGITHSEVGQALDAGRCGAVNPRTGMVCNVMPHPTSEKHWTIADDGQRYDWYMEVQP